MIRNIRRTLRSKRKEDTPPDLLLGWFVVQKPKLHNKKADLVIGGLSTLRYVTQIANRFESLAAVQVLLYLSFLFAVFLFIFYEELNVTPTSCDS